MGVVTAMSSRASTRGVLTPRDIQVASWVARGSERNDVAEILAMSRPAVNRHMAKIMKLTDSRNGTQAMCRLMALGYISAADVLNGASRIPQQPGPKRPPSVPKQPGREDQ